MLHVAFSPDSRRLVTAGPDRTARVWAVPSGQPLTPALRHSFSVTHAEFTPDGDPVPTSARQLSFRNVLIQKVDTRPGPYTDVNGAPVTDLTLNGSGEAALLRGGRIFRGTWSRSDRDEPTTFTDDDGNPLELAPGETIVELFPSDRDFSTF